MCVGKAVPHPEAGTERAGSDPGEQVFPGFQASSPTGLRITGTGSPSAPYSPSMISFTSPLSPKGGSGFPFSVPITPPAFPIFR